MAASDSEPAFAAALLVVDMQEDFCPPVCELAKEGLLKLQSS
jgi:hypothetical protein